MSLLALPNAILKSILDYLDLNELLKCRLISKEINEFIEYHLNGIQSCAIEKKYFNQKAYQTKRYTFQNESISLVSRLFVTKNVNFLNSNVAKNVLSRIKKLSIDHLKAKKCEWSMFELDINEFCNLNQLQINHLELSGEKEIKLRHLKILEILKFTGRKLKLNASYLNKLCWYDCDKKLEIINPLTITHLHLHNYVNAQFLRKFKNVQNLYFNQNTGQLNVILTEFHYLKEINFKLNDKDSIINLINQKNTLNKYLDLYFSNIQINELNDVDDLFKTHQNSIQPIDVQFIVKHYQRITRPIHLSTEIVYKHLVDYFNENLIEIKNFHLKFLNIQKVIVNSKIDNHLKFIEFVKRCKLLDELEIQNVKFNQLFFNSLNAYCPFLTKLEISDSQELELRFLINHHHLKQLFLNRQLTIEQIELLSKKFTGLKLKFMINDKLIAIDFNNSTYELNQLTTRYHGSNFLNFINGLL